MTPDESQAPRAPYLGPCIWINIVHVQLIGLAICDIRQVKSYGLVIHSSIHLSVAFTSFISTSTYVLVG